MSGTLSIFNYVFIFATLYFEVFLLITFFETPEEKEGLTNSSEFPLVDIIIPVFNEEKTIVKTLESALLLNYPKDRYHILVVNDGSTDRSNEVVNQFLTEHPDIANIKLISKENGGKHTALNLGITSSTAEFIGCLDADSFVDREALSLIIEKFKDPEVMSVTPSVVISSPNNLLRKTQKAEYQYGNFIRSAFSGMEAIHITPGPFSFYRKSVFDKIGLYRKAHNTEDMEMAMRLQKNHMKIANEPRALVYTVGPATIKKLYKQRVRWTSGFFGNLIDYRGMMFNIKYGDLGLLVLPFVGLSAALSFFLFFKALTSIGIDIWTAFERYHFEGFIFSKPTFDWFYFNTNAPTILGLTLTLTTLFTVWLGHRVATGKWKITFDAFYFITIYALLSPIWLIESIYNTVARRESSWR